MYDDDGSLVDYDDTDTDNIIPLAFYSGVVTPTSLTKFLHLTDNTSNTMNEVYDGKNQTSLTTIIFTYSKRRMMLVKIKIRNYD